MPQDTAIIFNIQKFSLNDGPGIRTVVFFKGCPLRCRWCSNPESQSHIAEFTWDADKCIGCRSCEAHCPARAISFDSGRFFADPARCTGCETCAKGCPKDALALQGRRRTVQDVLAVCRQDRDFYDESCGGVTLSGGEPMMQPEFAVSLLRALHDDGIHTAIETTGYVDPAVFQSIAEHLDCILFDVKHWHPDRHIKATGVSNERILLNLRWAIAHGKDVLPRIPVIPGYNDSAADGHGFARCLHDVGANRAQLLPFHQFGESKYALLGRDYAYSGADGLHDEDLAILLETLRDDGIDAFI